MPSGSRTKPLYRDYGCEFGWHIPTDAEWQILVDYLGGSAVAGGLMKETGFSYWVAPNTGANNQSGFTGLGSGHRVYYGNFDYINEYAEYWSSDEFSSGVGKFRFLLNSNSALSPYNYSKTYGFSVRCVLNE